MLTIGTRYPKCALITAENEGLITYDQIFVPTKVMNVSIEPDNQDPVKIYADDGVAATIPVPTTSGSLSVEAIGFTQKVLAKMLGHTVAENGAVTYSAGDMAPALGFGIIRTGWLESEAKKTFEVRFFPKVTFLNPTEEFATIGENIEHSPVTLEGKYVATSGSNSVLCEIAEFPAAANTKDAEDRALAQAQNWLNGKLGQNIQVHFDLNGANAEQIQGGQPADQNLAAGRNVPVGALPQLVREGFQFLGWALVQAGSHVAEYFIPGINEVGALVEGAQTLYAVWRENQE